MTPSEVVTRAAERGVQALALTDHDELSGLAEARETAAKVGVRLINGVEISASWKGQTLHVVGVMIDPANESLSEGLRVNRSGRDGRAERMAAELEKIGIPGTLEGARCYVTNPELVSRTHFARYLVDTGHARNMQNVFDRYLSPGKPGYVAHSWATLEEAVQWIIAAGGIAILAHPGRYKLNERERLELLGSFKEFGGIGIEVVTGSHTPEQFKYWGKRAQEHDLLASVGSDFHGSRESYRDLGDLPPLPAGCTPIWERFDK